MRLGSQLTEVQLKRIDNVADAQRRKLNGKRNVIIHIAGDVLLAAEIGRNRIFLRLDDLPDEIIRAATDIHRHDKLLQASRERNVSATS